MSLVAAIRPGDVNLPLFLHVLSAIMLVGVLVLVAASVAGASRDGSAAAIRLGFRSLLVAGLPAWIVMRLTGQWLLSEEELDQDPPVWVDIGTTTSETTLLLLIAATVCAGVAARRAARGAASGDGLGRAVVVLVAISVLAYLVVIWAMTTKPT
jgi:hypothetical protein